jgi:hypothetical protein
MAAGRFPVEADTLTVHGSVARITDGYAYARLAS